MVHSSRRIPAHVAIAAIAVATAACGPAKHEAAQAPEWDPCGAFPASVLQESGLDPQRRPNSGVAGVGCSWDSLGDKSLTVDVRYRRDSGAESWGKDVNGTTEPTTIGSHRGEIYHLNGDEQAFVCVVSLDTTGGGSVLFKLRDQRAGADPCSELTAVVSVLEKYLPAAGQ